MVLINNEFELKKRVLQQLAVAVIVADSKEFYEYKRWSY